MFKKDALKKTWNFLSAIASFIVVYKQVNALVEASEWAKENLQEVEKEIKNPLSTSFTQKEQVGSGV